MKKADETMIGKKSSFTVTGTCHFRFEANVRAEDEDAAIAQLNDLDLEELAAIGDNGSVDLTTIEAEPAR